MGTDFQGSNDYYYKGAGLVGASDGKLGIFSAWVYLDNLTSQHDILEGKVYFSAHSVITTGIFRLLITNSVGVTKLDLRSTTGLAAGAWYHIFGWLGT